EYWRKLHSGRAHELEAILDRAFVRLLMRNNLALPKRRKPHEANEATAMKCLAIVSETLRIWINRRPTIALQDPRADPGIERRGRPLINLVRPDAFGRHPRAVDSDDIIRMPRLEPRLGRFVQNVIGRRDHVRERKCLAGCITNRGK